MRKLVFLFCLSAWGANAADLYNFSLLPSGGTVQGAPTSTVGWGYTLQNQSNSLWLVPGDLNAGTFLHATPDLLFDFPILAPGEAMTQMFNPASSTGLFELTWDASAPVGFTHTGAFDLQAQWWNGDPFAGGVFVSDAPDASASYTANVTAASVPEPATFGLTAVLLLVLLKTRARAGARPRVRR